MDNSPRALDAISPFSCNGTTSFLHPRNNRSIKLLPCKTVREFLLIIEIFRKAEQAECLGVHLEGPWLSMKNLGAQIPILHCSGTESLALIEKYRDIVKMVTFSYHTLEAQTFLNSLTIAVLWRLAVMMKR